MIAIAVIGIVIGIFVLIGAIVGITALAQEWAKAKRKLRAFQTGAPIGTVFPEQYQPREIYCAWREPLEFHADSTCPHCGLHATHSMSKPKVDTSQYVMTPPPPQPRYLPWKRRAHRPMGDHPDAATIRHCRGCNHIWGEK